MRFLTAIVLSLLAHALLALALVAYVAVAPEPDALAQLDLSSVELSFAETVDETAAAQPSIASAPSEPEPEPEPPPPEPERPPEVEPPKKELPPEPEAMKIPEPKPEPPPMEMPPVRKPPEEEEPPKKEKPKPVVAAAAPSPAAAPRQARVDAPPKSRKNIKPDYPKGARQRGEQGDVLLEIVVSAAGAVEEVSVVSSSGYPELDEAAVRAVKSARFTPAKRGRQAVASTARITLTFKLK